MELTRITDGHLKDLNLRELRRLEKVYDDLCYGPNACYGVSDMVYLDMIQREIFKREEQNG